MPQRKVVDALLIDRVSVAILGPSDAQLDVVGREIARTLRARSDVHLEIYIPATAEALIGRFNQSLEALTLDAAQDDSDQIGPARVLLVPDVRSVATPEGMLLARLVGDFPGANTRLLMLVDRGASRLAEPVFAAMGRRLRVIPLGPFERAGTATPHGLADVRSSDDTSASESDDRESALKRGASRDRVLEPIVGRSLQSSDETAPASMARIRPHLPDLPDELPSHDPQAQRKARLMRRLGFLGIVVGLMLVSALIVVLLHRDRRSSPRADAPRLEQRVQGAPLTTYRITGGAAWYKVPTLQGEAFHGR